MSVVFNGSNQYLTYNSAFVTNYPFTMSAWFYSYSDTAIQYVTALTRRIPYLGHGYQQHTIILRGDLAGDPVYSVSYTDLGVSITCQPSVGYTKNRWHHAAAVFTASNDRSFTLDGIYKATSSVNGNVDSPDTTTVGAFRGTTGGSPDDSKTHYFSGRIAEFAMWNVSLNDDEINTLSKGFTPPSVRPLSLVSYHPLGGYKPNNGIDYWKNSYNLTSVNSPTWTDHPRIIYQSGSRNNFTPFPDYTTLLDVIHPTNYYTIDSNYPFLSVRNNREMLLFSSTVQQTACFSRIMPRTYTGNGCHVYLYVAASTDVASTQNATFSFDVAFERVGNRVQPIDSNNFSSNKNRYYEQVPEICGYIKCIKIPFTASQMSSIQAGELYTLRVQRSVAFDDATGTAELYAVEVRNV